MSKICVWIFIVLGFLPLGTWTPNIFAQQDWRTYQNFMYGFSIEYPYLDGKVNITETENLISNSIQIDSSNLNVSVMTPTINTGRLGQDYAISLYENYLDSLVSSSNFTSASVNGMLSNISDTLSGDEVDTSKKIIYFKTDEFSYLFVIHWFDKRVNMDEIDRIISSIKFM